MVQVTIGNNVKREKVIVDSSRTLKSVLDEQGVDYSRGSMHLDGSTIGPGGLDKTFDDYGIKESCFLLNVVKADNAVA